MLVINLIKLIAFEDIKKILALADKNSVFVHQAMQSTHHFAKRRHVSKDIGHGNDFCMTIFLYNIFCYVFSKKFLNSLDVALFAGVLGHIRRLYAKRPHAKTLETGEQC